MDSNIDVAELSCTDSDERLASGLKINGMECLLVSFINLHFYGKFFKFS